MRDRRGKKMRSLFFKINSLLKHRQMKKLKESLNQLINDAKAGNEIDIDKRAAAINDLFTEEVKAELKQNIVLSFDDFYKPFSQMYKGRSEEAIIQTAATLFQGQKICSTIEDLTEAVASEEGV
jgi:hypothetical protein